MPEGPIATVDLAAITHNLGRVRARLSGPTRVLAAVKANAYGHGSVPVARHLAAQGVTWFGVATPTEALELRSAGIEGDILIFSPVYDRLPELVAADVALTVAGPPSLDALVRADLPSPARVHLKIDTGMARLGGPPSEALELALAAERERNVRLEGVWTHFARADEPTEDSTRAQLERFRDAIDRLSRHGVEARVVHAANSAACFTLPEAAFDLIRPGIALYGYHASPALSEWEPDLVPALTLSAPVTFVKRVAAGTAVSYGHTWTAASDTTVATVRCGYADGYPRLLSNRAEARWNGQRLPVVGRVCMDQLLIDAGDRAVQVGDMIDLFGPMGPTADDLARAIGTISYELLTALAPRVERSYHNGS